MPEPIDSLEDPDAIMAASARVLSALGLVEDARCELLAALDEIQGYLAQFEQPTRN